MGLFLKDDYSSYIRIRIYLSEKSSYFDIIRGINMNGLK